MSGSPSDHIRLVAAAQVIVDMVDSEEGSSSSKSLVERLEEAPKKFFDVMMATSKNYLTHMIGVVKSYLPQFNLAPNSFVHMSVFVHLCEAFLGIEPHFDLFLHLFHLKP